MFSSSNIFPNLRSPLAANANGTITFKVYEESVDADTEPVSTEVTITGIFHQVSLEDATNPSMDKNTINFRGRLTNPLTLPAGIKNGMRGSAAIAGIEGTFNLFIPPQNPYVKGQLGDKIEGYLTRNYN